MPHSPKIIELRKILAERFPQKSGTHLLTSTGWSPLDSLLGGGLPAGSITQLVIPSISAGGAIVLHEIIEAMHERSQCLALIDGKNSFEPFTESPLLPGFDAKTPLKLLRQQTCSSGIIIFH